ncbi:alpha/beta hydrolase-fold protein [Streptomyces sp. ZAF1911]|uniref:alpha/beta hydrolase-fold protein n=1 Tax=Streptomyces sp. ZAF1911 TaxID=2944129 RepID=UPI00237C102A|nr:alpha/beta hydrolase-fold protein [Streptomyces sp. ZAF1911]MDD9383108.1 alpha/beta hydrolase-fold protein [Streptomyces sp. ZAF1911]
MPSPPSASERPASPHSRANLPGALTVPTGARILLESPFQQPGTQVTVILPEQRVRRIVLALPVEKGDGKKYGRSLDEIGRLPADLRDATAFAAPTFSESPWLVNHATRADCQQEDHFVRVVVPTVLAALGGQDRPPVHLLGFSKGGFAALNLLTRHPDLFAVASVWDPSLLSDRPPHPQLVDVAGSTARLDEYDVRQNLRRHAQALRGAGRIALGGVGTLEADWTAGHQLLEALEIPHHAYRDAPAEHRWDAAWLAPAMRHLLALEARLYPGQDQGPAEG